MELSVTTLPRTSGQIYWGYFLFYFIFDTNLLLRLVYICPVWVCFEACQTFNQLLSFCYQWWLGLWNMSMHHTLYRNGTRVGILCRVRLKSRTGLGTWALLSYFLKEFALRPCNNRSKLYRDVCVLSWLPRDFMTVALVLVPANEFVICPLIWKFRSLKLMCGWSHMLTLSSMWQQNKL